ncbi:hypothetical protein ILYODFUR_013044 [Ilyodon furcidens]|uniref:Uncharacterized protein n=1 Tax=Ilyodon furcidens TaxID=33524 RepID=A0ABV0UFM3_9TELE
MCCFEDDLTLLGLASKQPAEPVPFSQIFLSSPCYLPIAVPVPATVSLLHCFHLFWCPPPSFAAFIKRPPVPLSFYLFVSLSVFSPSLALCCLNKVAFIRMSCNPNKPNKRYGRENLPAEEGGSYRASLCVPACQLAMPPATANPSPSSHTHTH